MKIRSSYDPEKFSHSKVEIDRLRGRAILDLNFFLRILKEQGFKNGMKILDVGSGTGFHAGVLAKRFPKSKIVGIDRSEAMVAEGRKLAKLKGLKNLSFEVSDRGQSSERNFDIAYSRLVLQHVPKPINLLTQVKQNLKPGGKFVVIEADRDWLSIDPEPKVWKTFFKTMVQNQIKLKGDPFAGRKAAGWLAKAGFKTIEQDIIAWSEGQEGMKAFSEGLIQSFLNLFGGKSKTFHRRVLKEVAEVAQLPYARVFYAWFIATGVK